MKSHGDATILCIISTALWAAGVQSKCNADNCYRALFPCGNPNALTSAISFCQALLTSSPTPAQPLTTPTRATAACGTGSNSSRYLSACSCGPTCTSTTTTTPNTACPTPTALVPNGDFECIYNIIWTPQVPDPSAQWELRQSPGANTGQFSFEAKLLNPPSTPELGVSVRITSQPFPVTPGVQYKLGFASWFDDLSSGFIGVMINGLPIYTVDAGDKQPVGVWHDNTVLYTPASGVTSLSVRFEFLFGNQHVPSVQRVDSVTFTPV